MQDQARLFEKNVRTLKKGEVQTTTTGTYPSMTHIGQGQPPLCPVSSSGSHCHVAILHGPAVNARAEDCHAAAETIS